MSLPRSRVSPKLSCIRFFAFVLFIFFHFVCFSQEIGFSYGLASYEELEMTEYDRDTTAVALILNEFGKAYVDEKFYIQFSYHARIKILKSEGLSQATFEIPLRKSEGRAEKVYMLKASSFNIENGSIQETKLQAKNVYSEKVNKYFDAKKFAIPNVKVGSVIDVSYLLESPFIYNFRSWEFQSEIPKLKSEYLCFIPGIYHYNILLRGFLELSKNESELAKGRFSPAGRSADTLRLWYGMTNVPAFKAEEFMTAKSNFISSIHFELSQINYLDGRQNRITKEWKDAEDELAQHRDFGLQIKRGQDILGSRVNQVVEGEKGELGKAQKIYDFIKGLYKWNGDYGNYSDNGIKKALEGRVGNVGDINLSLIAALKHAGLSVEPVLLSTRENGMPTELYPVISDFNYVIAKVVAEGKEYLLDATDPFHSFGLLPERCLNGNGRALRDKEPSYWQDLMPSERQRTLSIVNLNLNNSRITGTIQYTFSGYAAANERRKIAESTSHREYIDSLETKLHLVSVSSFSIENVDNIAKPLVVRLDVEVEIETGSLSNDYFMLNPFIVQQWEQNPFRSSERLYPVDFGAPLEEILILNLTYPSDFELDEIPTKVALKLPANGGHYIFEINDASNKLSMANTLVIAKPIFTSQEYHYLKELFNNVIATEQTQLVFKKKK